jgi:hypothetical protein
LSPPSPAIVLGSLDHGSNADRREHTGPDGSKVDGPEEFSGTNALMISAIAIQYSDLRNQQGRRRISRRRASHPRRVFDDRNVSAGQRPRSWRRNNNARRGRSHVDEWHQAIGWQTSGRATDTATSWAERTALNDAGVAPSHWQHVRMQQQQQQHAGVT